MTEAGRTALEELEAEVAAMPAGELPDLLGRLETIKGRAYARLTAPEAPQPAPTVQAAPERKPAERLLTPKQAAELLGRSASWISRHRAELPHVLLPGGRAGYSAPGLERWILDRSS